MTSSLVGSEMCIRDRLSRCRHGEAGPTARRQGQPTDGAKHNGLSPYLCCLLYTSDAADDM
eukprot:6650031-Prorocentrum_lima.AAC.1